MGFYVHTSNVNLSVPAEHVDAAFQAVKELNKRDDLKTGGRYSGGKVVERWFAWMPADYDEVYKSLDEVFWALGFEDAHIDDDGRFVLGRYDDKTGAENHFLEAIAPFVVDGSYVEWVGEDGSMWRFLFRRGEMLVEEGMVVYG